MAHTGLRWISNGSLLLAMLVGIGCGKNDDTGDTGSEETGTTGATDSVTATMSASSSASASTSMTSAGSADSGSESVGTFETSAGDSSTGATPMPNGSMCDEDAGCESGHCFVVGVLGGICGECNSDADCASTTGHGCSIPNPLANPPQGAVCNNGEHAEGCMSDDVCVDPLVCAEILNVPGILVASTCSECLDDTGCMNGDLCSPTYDVLNLSGSKDCVAPGSVADGLGCDLEGSGDDACMSGHCATADVMGLLQLGVCSECEVDGDCMMGQTCAAPMVDITMGLIAGVCM